MIRNGYYIYEFLKQQNSILILKLSEKITFRTIDEYVPSSDLSIYYTLEYLKESSKNN